MLTGKRRGVIGFMLTMAVGIALGAAALVVSNEMVRENDGKTGTAGSQNSGSPVAVEKAFEGYQKAYKDYQQAVGLGRADQKKYFDAFQEAKRKLEREIFRNTPGVSEMDLSGISGASDTAAANNAPSMTFAETNISPFGEGTVLINPGAGSALSSGGTGNPFDVRVSNQPPTALTTKSTANAPVASDGDATVAQPIADAQISSMEYYRVKSGDSLAKICQKYYGDSGMWQHILKYQIPSIVGTPNLIFPGQLIALPRGFTQARDENSFAAGNSAGNSAGTAATDGTGAGNHKIAAAGDESWQTKFQKDYLISDKVLTDTQTMTVQQIQSFLEAKNSVLAKPYRGSSPAQMIFDAAKNNGINPQVLLTRLQCEQGMISKTTATQKQLDWALGVGCYDSGNWNQSLKGLDKQIEYAAKTYRRHYDAAKTKLDNGEAISMNIDGQQVRIKNAASYAFYKYCPHFQGNKLFYDVWNGYKSRF